jgi:hypothetical protein
MLRNREIAWHRIAAEGVAIVISILLAFSIQAWWEDRNERIDKLEVLTALQDELKHNIGLMADELRFRRAMVEPITRLLDLIGKDKLPGQSELDGLFGLLVWWSTTNPATGVFHSLGQGRQLSQIEQTELRAQISSLSTTYQQLALAEQQSFQTFKELLMPYLIGRVDIVRALNAQRSNPRGGPPVYPVFPGGRPSDYESVLADLTFQGILVNMLWDQYDAIRALERTTESLESLIQAIDEAV